MKKILLIDDDRASMRYYMQELEANNVKCMQEQDTDKALAIIEKEGGSFDLIILDSALPPGKDHTEAQTDGGTLTGSLLFDKIRKKHPTVPILILTNFWGLDWVQKARRRPKVSAERKLDMLPSELVKKVNDMIRTARA